ncbi:MAG: hypothetical protein EPN86_04925 [Nanoarchaeota archaeon]|nr:MAG: hypothetical protein EPN86_04925 [Nanoarchaeota archaeon]
MGRPDLVTGLRLEDIAAIMPVSYEAAEQYFKSRKIILLPYSSREYDDEKGILAIANPTYFMDHPVSKDFLPTTQKEIIENAAILAKSAAVTHGLESHIGWAVDSDTEIEHLMRHAPGAEYAFITGALQADQYEIPDATKAMIKELIATMMSDDDIAEGDVNMLLKRAVERQGLLFGLRPGIKGFPIEFEQDCLDNGIRINPVHGLQISYVGQVVALGPQERGMAAKYCVVR